MACPVRKDYRQNQSYSKMGNNCFRRHISFDKSIVPRRRGLRLSVLV